MTKVRKIINDNSTAVWRVLVILIFTMGGFYGKRMYAGQDSNTAKINILAIEVARRIDLEPLQAAIEKLNEKTLKKDEALSMQTDIRELREEISRLNVYFRELSLKGKGG